MMFARYACLTLALTLSIHAEAAPLFPGEIIPTGAKPAAAVSADFNDDGHADLAVADEESNDVSVLLNDGSGGFSLAGNHGVGIKPQVILSEDFNNDGNWDLAVANDDSNSVSVLLGDGSGGFFEAVDYAAGKGLSLVSADFNGDGETDLAVENALLLGDGLGGFTVQEFATISGASLTSGDFNGDGNADLARVSDLFNVALGDGSGGFSASVGYGAGHTDPGLISRELASADLNGDGYADLVLSDFMSDKVMVMLADGAGGFMPIIDFSVGKNPISLALEDISGDGDLDMVVGNYGSNDVSVLLGNGAGGFSAAVNYAAGAFPRVYAVADLNSDGHLDLAVGGMGFNAVRMLLGDGAGGFVAAANHVAGSNAIFVTSADFNGDGQPDLAVTNSGSNVNDVGDVSVLLGDGAGDFSVAENYEVGLKPGSVSAADFNGDGSADLVVLNESSFNVSVLLSDDSGGFFAPVNYVEGTVSTAITTADFNGDGKADIAVAHDGGMNKKDISILLSDGSGGFVVVPHDFRLLLWQVTSIISADFDGDGHADIAAVGLFGTQIILGDGAGGLSVAQTIDAMTGAFLTHADFNADGLVDIAVAVAGDPGEIKVILGHGAGNFTASESYAVGVWPSSIASADFNGDGHVDMAVTGFYSNDVGLLLGDGSGDFSVAPASYAVGSIPRSIAIADFDGNGRADIAVAGNAVWLDLNGAKGTGYVTVLLNQSTTTVPTGRIVIEGGNAATNSSAVTLSLSCSDDVGCTQMQFSNDGVTWGGWVAYTADANWTLATGGDGVRTVYARFRDADDNISALVNDQIMLDTAAPAAPVITAPVDNTVTPSLARPTISGTAEADASVVVKNGAVVLGTVFATNGQWTVVGGGATLAEGTYSFTATATDQAGNTGPASTVVTYTVDTSAVVDQAAPIITLIGANPLSIVQDSIFIDPGSTVTDNVDTGLTATVSGAVDTAVPGTYTLTYTVSDAAGNTASATRTVTVLANSPGTNSGGGGGGIDYFILFMLLTLFGRGLRGSARRCR